MERAWVVIAIVLLGAVGIVVLGALMAPGREHDIWVELVSRASQLIVLALAGGVVGAVIHDRDAAREDERRRQAFLLGFIGEVETAFGQVKTARRLVRTYGFDVPRDTPLTAQQVEGFRTQLALLNDAQLQFETLARKVEALPGPFGEAHTAVAAELSAIHSYLNGILRDWQADPTVLIVGSDTMALTTWTRFGDFVGYGEGAELDFRQGVADRIAAIEVRIHDLGTV
jgi:hypothetical protein